MDGEEQKRLKWCKCHGETIIIQEGVKIYSMVLTISRNKVNVFAKNGKHYTVPAMALIKEDDKGNKMQKKIQAIIDKEIHDVMISTLP